MIEGRCHCGSSSWRIEGRPEKTTLCNCSFCWRAGALWAYGHEGETISVHGETGSYAWGDKTLDFHFCAGCGGVGFWRSRSLDAEGRRRMAVNLRWADPEEVADIPIHRFDGRDSFESRGADGRCIADIGF